MLKTGILNPAILALLARVRHANILVIADRGFPYWPQIETVDLSLTDDIPTARDFKTSLLGCYRSLRAHWERDIIPIAPD